MTLPRNYRVRRTGLGAYVLEHLRPEPVSVAYVVDAKLFSTFRLSIDIVREFLAEAERREEVVTNG